MAGSSTRNPYRTPNRLAVPSDVRRALEVEAAQLGLSVDEHLEKILVDVLSNIQYEEIAADLSRNY